MFTPKYKFLSVLGILMVSLTILLCFPWAAIAQFGEQRLIPLFTSDGFVPSGASTTEGDTKSVEKTIPAQAFVVYGRADEGYPPINAGTDSPDTYVGEGAYKAGILVHVPYQQIPYSRGLEPSSDRMPDLEAFFEFGGTLELLTPEKDSTGEASTLNKHDLVMSEIMWAIDEGFDENAGTGTVKIQDPVNPDNEIDIAVPQLDNQEIQWIELYNTTNSTIDLFDGSNDKAKLYFLFTPFRSYPTRDTVELELGGEKTTYKVLDTVDTLFTGLWKLPGKRGDRPNTAFVSAYRKIDYDTVEMGSDRDVQVAGIPFGSDPNNWAATSDSGRRNTDLKIIYKGKVVELLAVGTPGAKHVTGIYVGRLQRTSVPSNTVVINEVRNDTSKDNVDWVELKNISTGIVDLKDWELSIVTGKGVDNDLVKLPEYELGPGEILLLLNKDPWFTSIAGGANINDPDQQEKESARKFLVDTRLHLPNTGKFVLLLRNKSDQNGKDKAIQDYAGNGFFEDFTEEVSTRFWPRIGQQLPADVANFGTNSFAARDRAWARIRYQANDGHHEDAWENVGTEGGFGYDPSTNFLTSPGTPGYDNDAVKSNDGTTTDERELTDGEISISEIMYDPGPNQNRVQWIELYNSSMMQALNLKGWKLRIRNFHDRNAAYIEGTVTFKDVVILPNQTLLIVPGKAATDLPDNRVYDLYRNHRRDLGMIRSQLLLNPIGFHLTLTDTAVPESLSDDVVVDEVGNLTVEGGTRSKAWDLPPVNPDRRRSIVRLYGGIFRPQQGSIDGEPSPPDDGLSANGWRLFPADGLNSSYYGALNDLANPGHRSGGPLPVSLSSFRPVRDPDTGHILITWVTESELNNAGFNILRGVSKAGEFKVINLKGIIAGHGTTSEKHLYTYRDTTAKPNVVYYYQLEDVSLDGKRTRLMTTHLRGNVTAAGKVTTTWADLKSND